MKRGQSYVVFDCEKPLDDILREVPKIRALAQIPRKLELKRVEGPANLRGSQRVETFGRKAQNLGLKYGAEASLEGASNEETAEELSAFLNQAYQSTLYEEGPYRGAVGFEDCGTLITQAYPRDLGL